MPHLTPTDPADPMQANPLAAELRQILADLGGKPEHMTRREALVHERLHRLTEHVERFGTETEPATTTASLDVEQECRADALTAAARLLAPALAGMPLVDAEVGRDIITRLWLELAYAGDAWITDGHRPVDDAERDDRRRP